MEAIVLAGGLGTRLSKSLDSDTPKILAPINSSTTFLDLLISYLENGGVTKIIFSLGHLGEKVKFFLESNYPNLNYKLHIEDSPLGTGGAIKASLEHAQKKEVIVINGDTILQLDFGNLLRFHTIYQSDCTICVKQLYNFERYGSIELDEEQNVISFNEKKKMKEGLINGGVFVLNRNIFKNYPLQEFSFEIDFLPEKMNDNNFKIKALITDGAFIDIGIPKDLKIFRSDFQKYL